MQAQLGGDRLLGASLLLDRCRDPSVPVAPHGPGRSPRADTRAIDGPRRGPPGGELPSFLRPVPWYTRPRVCDAQRPGQRASPSHPGPDGHTY